MRQRRGAMLTRRASTVLSPRGRGSKQQTTRLARNSSRAPTGLPLRKAGLDRSRRPRMWGYRQHWWTRRR
eukprot:382122-Pyramimonas_sp.AAC.1